MVGGVRGECEMIITCGVVGSSAVFGQSAVQSGSLWPVGGCNGNGSSVDWLCRYDDQQLWRALEVSHLKDAVSKLDGKLEARVSEGGLAGCTVPSHGGPLTHLFRREFQCGAAATHVPCKGSASQDQGMVFGGLGLGLFLSK